MALETYLVDGIRALGVHNGVVRVSFVRLDSDGKSSTDLEILIPESRVKEIAATLANVQSGRR